ncbi:MAG TPA: lyase family protein [Acidimicrobiia bacterium]
MSSGPSLDPGFSTEELTAVFSAQSTVTAILGFEAALALALVDAGIAPANEADQVVAACDRGVADPDAVLASTWETGTPLIALEESIAEGIETEEARKWFHFGATSQDAIDTGRMVQAARALEILDPRLSALAGRLRQLTIEYRDQPHMGRTFLQAARPTTFGFRTATWLDSVLGHIEDLRQQRSDLKVQLGGPVGTLSAYGDKTELIVSSLAQRLDLAQPEISWHANRTGVIRLAHSLQRTAITMGKIGSDIALLASTGIAEIRVRSGGSSSMPEKHNPLDSIRSVAAAAACTGAVAMLESGSGHELDRGIGGWHVEWLALPLAFQTAGAAVEAIATCMASLEVDRERMSANLGSEALEVPSAQVDRVLAIFDRSIA